MIYNVHTSRHPHGMQGMRGNAGNAGNVENAGNARECQGMRGNVVNAGECGECRGMRWMHRNVGECRGIGENAGNICKVSNERRVWNINNIKERWQTKFCLCIPSFCPWMSLCPSTCNVNMRPEEEKTQQFKLPFPSIPSLSLPSLIPYPTSLIPFLLFPPLPFVSDLLYPLDKRQKIKFGFKIRREGSVPLSVG